jgi:predicted ATPase
MNRRVIITGGPGFGKSSIIDELERRNFRVFHEVARQIIDRQLAMYGNKTPWEDVERFSDLVLEGRKDQFDIAQPRAWSFFDRGIPDIAAFLMADGKEIPKHIHAAAMDNSYFNVVFITPPWEEIYTNDEARPQSFEYATNIHEAIVDCYSKFGYTTLLLPKISITQRADYVLKALGIFDK